MTSMGPERKQKGSQILCYNGILDFSAYNMYVGLFIEVKIITEVLVMNLECVTMTITVLYGNNV